MGKWSGYTRRVSRACLVGEVGRGGGRLQAPPPQELTISSTDGVNSVFLCLRLCKNSRKESFDTFEVQLQGLPGSRKNRNIFCVGHQASRFTSGKRTPGQGNQGRQSQQWHSTLIQFWTESARTAQNARKQAQLAQVDGYGTTESHT